MCPSAAAQQEAVARTSRQDPGAVDEALFGRREPLGGLGLVSAPASPQALHPLMEQPAEFQGQLHPFASGARQPHQTVATLAQNERALQSGRSGLDRCCQLDGSVRGSLAASNRTGRNVYDNAHETTSNGD